MTSFDRLRHVIFGLHARTQGITTIGEGFARKKADHRELLRKAWFF
jgi:hypothetical protein